MGACRVRGAVYRVHRTVPLHLIFLRRISRCGGCMMMHAPTERSNTIFTIFRHISERQADIATRNVSRQLTVLTVVTSHVSRVSDWCETCARHPASASGAWRRGVWGRGGAHGGRAGTARTAHLIPPSRPTVPVPRCDLLLPLIHTTSLPCRVRPPLAGTPPAARPGRAVSPTLSGAALVTTRRQTRGVSPSVPRLPSLYY